MGNSTTDGLGFEEVNQDVTSTTIIKSNYAYISGSIDAGGHIYTSDSIQCLGSITASNKVSAVGRMLSPIGTGSPTGWGYGMQAGVVSGTNVAVAVSFGTAFKSAPMVTTQLLISGAQATNAGCILGPAALGSFVFLGVSGAPYSWLAVGSL